MSIPMIQMTRRWEDSDFFEVNYHIIGNFCAVDFDSYHTKKEFEELKSGITNFSNQQGQNDYCWRTENNGGLLSLHFFRQNMLGQIGIKVEVKNGYESPHSIHSKFFILCELGQLDDFSRMLGNFTKEEYSTLEWPSAW